MRGLRICRGQSSYKAWPMSGLGSPNGGSIGSCSDLPTADSKSGRAIQDGSSRSPSSNTWPMCSTAETTRRSTSSRVAWRSTQRPIRCRKTTKRPSFSSITYSSFCQRMRCHLIDGSSSDQRGLEVRCIKTLLELQRGTHPSKATRGG